MRALFSLIGLVLVVVVVGALVRQQLEVSKPGLQTPQVHTQPLQSAQSSAAPPSVNASKAVAADVDRAVAEVKARLDAAEAATK